jgi:hypothetical protein
LLYIVQIETNMAILQYPFSIFKLLLYWNCFNYFLVIRKINKFWYIKLTIVEQCIIYGTMEQLYVVYSYS